MRPRGESRLTPTHSKVWLSEKKTREQRKEELQLALLRLIHWYPGIGSDELAARLGIGKGTLDRQLRALAGMGLLRTNRFQTLMRRSTRACHLTTNGLAAKAALTRDMLESKLAEAEKLQAEIISLRKAVARNTPRRG